MFEFVGNIVGGGWNAISNVVNSVGSGANSLVSSFFPAAQKTVLNSNLTQAAGGAGTTFRSVFTENQSMIETAKYADNAWLGSPYQSNLSLQTKITEAANLAKNISATQPKSISGMLADIWGNVKSGVGAATEQVSGITTIVDEFKNIFGLNKQAKVSSGPTEIGNSPGTTINVGPTGTAGADTTLSNAVQGFINQVKGLFNLGYPQTETQLTSPVTTSAGGMSMTTILIIGAVIVGIILLARKK